MPGITPRRLRCGVVRRDHEGSAVDILELLDQMEEELAAGRKMPFGGGVTVDRRRFGELINELRLAIPANVRQARGIIERSEQAISEAQSEAARIIANADREAADRVASSEIILRATEEANRIEAAARDTAERTTRSAEARAEGIIADAERVAQQQKDEADAYAVSLLNQLQRTLGAFLGNVRESLRSFPDQTQAADDGMSDQPPHRA